LISISIVSHQQIEMVTLLLNDLNKFSNETVFEVILTINVKEKILNNNFKYSFPLKVLHNQSPRGFGANHNAALRQASGDFFCILNPDVRLKTNPFLILQRDLILYEAGIIAPIVLNKDFEIEDSVRYFPTLKSLIMKFINQSDGRYFFSLDAPSFEVDWVAGMFMLFKSKDFLEIDGFDEKFFLYYEDVDICIRFWKAGKKVLACPQVTIIHDAQRQSRMSLRYMKWHLFSMTRYFWKHFNNISNITHN